MQKDTPEATGAENLAQEYVERLYLPHPREPVEVKVGLKELVVGLLAIGLGALLLGGGYTALKSHLERKKYGYYIHESGKLLNGLAALLSGLERGKP